MLGDDGVNCKKLFEYCFQAIQVECVGTVGLGVRGVVMNLKEDAVDSSGNGGAS